MRSSKTINLVPVLAAAVLVLAGCGGGDDGNGVDGGGDGGTATSTPADGGGTSGLDDLDGRTFLSTAVREDGADRPLVSGTRISLVFDDGTVGASAGCNQMGGDYALDGDVLVIDGGLSMTEMGCDPERHDQDAWVADLLTSRPVLSLAGDELTVTGERAEIVLLDREVADPDRPLVGTVWTVDTLIEGETASSMPEGVTATIEFTDEGQVNVFTGCNNGGGAADVGERAVTFTEMRFEQIGCTGGAGEVEAAVIAVLDGEVSYEIAAGNLRLDAGERGLGLHA